MIAARIYGGLGNQIFQFAAALLLAEKSESRLIKIDPSSTGNYNEKRSFLLFELFNKEKLTPKIKIDKIQILNLRIPKIFSLCIPKFPFVGDSNFEYILRHPSKITSIMDGYFQDSLTQELYESAAILLKNSLHKNYASIVENDTCAIHIRGGDFIKLGWDSVTPRSYYLEAIEILKNNNIDEYLVITDDIPYASEIMKKINVRHQFFSGSQMDDFKKIMQCKHRILSSSTFAFWASTLGNNPSDGLVTAPDFWTPTRKRRIKIKNEIIK